VLASKPVAEFGAGTTSEAGVACAIKVTLVALYVIVNLVPPTVTVELFGRPLNVPVMLVGCSVF